MSSGAKGVRSCLGWPFWPPILRLRFPQDVWLFFGLTISLEGGLEELREFFFSRAISSCNVSILLSKNMTVSRSCRFSSINRARIASLDTIPSQSANPGPEAVERDQEFVNGYYFSNPTNKSNLALYINNHQSLLPQPYRYYNVRSTKNG